MLVEQRPVADPLRCWGERKATMTMSVKKERPQYSCNFDKCVKAFGGFLTYKITKKAPELFAAALLEC